MHDMTNRGAAMAIMVPVSWGEVIDKITILEIKNARLTDDAKRDNVRRELNLLVTIREREFPRHAELAKLADALRSVNERLWDVEDEIRDQERAKTFGPRFVELARAVYVTNDQRSILKRRINELL